MRRSEGTVHDPSVFVVFEQEDLDALAEGENVLVQTEEHGVIIFTSGWGQPSGCDYTPTVTTPAEKRTRSTLERLEDGEIISWKPTPTDGSVNTYSLSILAAVKGWFKL